MAYKFEKTSSGTQDLVIDGWENGISNSPHTGVANMQGVNISTETGEAMCSYGRTLQSQVTGTGTFTQVNTNTVSVSGINLRVGSWVHITSGGATGLSGDYYYLSTGKLSRAYHNSTTQVVNSRNISFLAVGGGAGALGNTGSGIDGGGGAGRVASSTSVVSINSYPVTVGAGGASNTDGSASSFMIVTAQGGHTSTTGTGGNSGGNIFTGGTNGGSGNLSGGGAGSSQNGANGAVNTSGSGGNGTTSSISGSSVVYAGGGGGSATAGNNAGTGGTGGGGNGGTQASPNGTNATGFGSGGGGGTNVGTGGTGSNGVVIVSYPSGTITATGGTITTSGGNTIHTFTSNGTFAVSSLNPTSFIVSGITSGSATFSVYSMGSPLQSSTESYTDPNGIAQYRYYILDSLGQVWVHDTATLSGLDTPLWFMTELPTLSGRSPSGLAVLNNWLTIAFGSDIYWKPTASLDVLFVQNSNYIYLTSVFHATLVGHQGKMYATDKNYITSMFPNSSLITGANNVQSNCAYTTGVGGAPTVTDLIGGTFPFIDANTRVPVVFYTSSDGTLPSSITAGTIYYVISTATSPSFTFSAYAASSGGSTLDLSTGATGNQFFTTFYPLTGGETAITYTLQRLNLPYFETAQCMAELGNTVVIGCSGNVLYPWDQVSPTPGDLIPLPENNTQTMLTVNNILYVFSGQKGNIYITNGSSAALALKVPDYCAGIPGTPNTYIEPYFSWGGASYIRGRVYFSILDQTATKSGNCGGIWSFVPTQNFFIGQDTGQSLRLENQSSYGTYSGVCPVIVRNENQIAISPQYWSSWYSSIMSPTYGIDYTDTIPQQAIIETDLVPTGTMLKNETFAQLEYKLSSPLASGDSVSLFYRQNSTDSFMACSSIRTINAPSLSGYASANFQSGQWIQLRAILTPLSSSSSSFIRLKELRIRQ